ncbi:hypothetical protein KUTG_09993 [Kutzneria sp. 744]|nr:hypothetical protein KUTG_09993 [Kutzneria sp. 744]
MLYEVPLLTADSGHAIVAWWRCTATVTATATAIGTPTRMPGAAHVLHAGQVLHCTEHVVIDTEASQLEQAVNGTRVHYIDTFATSPTRARALAEERAHQLHEA